MSARDDILSAIRTHRTKSATRAAPYRLPELPKEPIAQFLQRAEASAATVKRLTSLADVPAAIAELLRDRNLPAYLHLPPDAHWETLPWQAAPSLTLLRDPPGPDDAALSLAPYAIAETGTLVYPSDAMRPASWHFRAGFEIAILRADAIQPHLETVLARIKSSGIPHTINLVTGPSRTGDIEQTLELGAHGPKALAILVVDGD